MIFCLESYDIKPQGRKGTYILNPNKLKERKVGKSD